MKKAIDIVILPPDDIVDLMIAMDKRSESHDPIILNKENRLPHLSLLMGVMDDTNDRVLKEIEKIASHTKSFELTLDRYQASSKGNGLYCTKASEDLLDLHKALIKDVDPLLTHDSSTEYFADEYVDNVYVDYVNTFVQNASFDNFNPHITTRIQKEPVTELPISFTAQTLAVFQLGQRCTCVNEIARYALS